MNCPAILGAGHPRRQDAGSHRDAFGPPYSESEIVGRGPWQPVIPESQWRAVAAILTDPSRRNGPGPVPRYLGSLIYYCGKCDDGTRLAISRSTTASDGRHSRYTCYPERQLSARPASERRWHLSRNAALVDEYVEEALKARLRRPDAADLIPTPDEKTDLAALRAEETSIRELMLEQARLHARRVLTGEQLEAGTRELQASLGQVRAQIAAAEESSPLAALAGRPDIDDIWPRLDLGRTRAILRALVDVTITPATQRGPRFDPDSVLIDFGRRRSLDAERRW
ncbi:MAG: hypothetical protein ACRDOK_30615 [Streptosporangiaceae bacterium]